MEIKVLSPDLIVFHHFSINFHRFLAILGHLDRGLGLRRPGSHHRPLGEVPAEVRPEERGALPGRSEPLRSSDRMAFGSKNGRFGHRNP